MANLTGPFDFQPTHVVPREGLPAWEEPDASRPTVPLDPFLPVQLLSRRGEWGEILCANGWSAWVDGRLLVAVPEPPPTGGRPVTHAEEDPLPLLAHCAETLQRYRRAAEELAAGRTDTEGFRRATQGLRVGIVVDDEAVWLYEEASGRWMYGDGTRLTTYAVGAGPGDPAESEPPAAETERKASPGARVDTATAGGRTPGAPGHGPGREPGRVPGGEGREPTQVVAPPDGG
ncbi:hypothetical protein OHB36_21150 [Streptomyces sp. NBC_00320]|uniref:hypothetical protein n=1 Tax=Streptomyces sp. NBC_00320 TaxID=2975711 RepID=UPI002253BF6F|nr:hypothetical protein [Streptomyces sp. NBC_00320]MCX5149254.1 hypothetical protein [Streptomyces sp. NBC_00320]